MFFFSNNRQYIIIIIPNIRYGKSFNKKIKKCESPARGYNDQRKNCLVYILKIMQIGNTASQSTHFKLVQEYRIRGGLHYLSINKFSIPYSQDLRKNPINCCKWLKKWSWIHKLHTPTSNTLGEVDANIISIWVNIKDQDILVSRIITRFTILEVWYRTYYNNNGISDLRRSIFLRARSLCNYL